ncbi:hypothetical protein BH09ACT12_BH09ACT12_08770 [soil metagenome]
MDVRPVADDQWDVVAWLWQAFRNDLAPHVDGFPYPDGRYNASRLDDYPGPGRSGWLAWAPHPNTGEDAPIALALVKGAGTSEQSLAEFWVVPALRGTGVAAAFAADVLGRFPAPWTVAFQHANVRAGRFWRSAFTATFGADGWVEAERLVPHRPDAPPDHWIETVDR